jgi:hypothetical protein
MKMPNSSIRPFTKLRAPRSSRFPIRSREIRSGTYTNLNHVWKSLHDRAETAVYLDADMLPVGGPIGPFEVLPDHKESFGLWQRNSISIVA